MGGLEIEVGEITQANLGDVLVYSYAEFVRQWDEASVRAKVLGEVATIYEEQTATGISGTVNELAKLSLRHELKPEDIPIDFTDELKATALLGAIWRNTAEASGERRGSYSASDIQFEGEKDSIVWPIGSTVRVTDTLQPYGHINKDGNPYDGSIYQRPKRSLTGQLSSVDLNPGTNNPGSMRIYHRGKGYRVGPIVSRDDGYTTPISLEVL
jgi:hypothetical protein